jgi:hypothetical protein
MYKIICAAARNNKTKSIICGVRHFDKIMSDACANYKSKTYRDWEQGFVDSYGNFLNRKEALQRCKEMKQPLINTDKSWFKDELYSENLY